MMPDRTLERREWSDANAHALIDGASDALLAGKLVVFPTETVYGIAANALDESAVARLVAGKGRATDKPLALALADPGQATQYVPSMSPVGRRLVERCWPGPLTIVFPVGEPEAGLGRLPASVQERVVSPAGVGLRVPDHPAILGVLRSLPGPLALSSANASGQADARDPESAAEQLAGIADLLIADGPTRFAQPSSVVKLTDGGFQMLREGVLSESKLRRLASEVITFVCTGNTCRSPMAEAIFKRLLADRLGCEIEQLPERGFTVLSAGVASYDGGPAARSACEIVREFNASLDDHVTQRLTPELAYYSDRIVVMTRDHRSIVLESWPELAEKTTMLAGPTDIRDPVGGTTDHYRQCADQIAAHLRQLVDSILTAS